MKTKAISREAIKRAWKKALPFLFLLLAILFVVHVVFSLVRDIRNWKYGMIDIPGFSKNKSSFALIAKRMRKCYDEEKEKNEDLSWIIYLDNGGNTLEWKVNCHLKDGTDYTVTANLTEKEGNALKKVRECFGKIYSDGTACRLDSIRATEDQVDLAASLIPYSVIYTDRTMKPKYLFYPGDRFDAYFDRLSWNWYQGVEKPLKYQKARETAQPIE